MAGVLGGFCRLEARPVGKGVSKKGVGKKRDGKRERERRGGQRE